MVARYSFLHCWAGLKQPQLVSSADLPSNSLCENLAWWTVTRRTLKNHKTVKIGVWALARDTTLRAVERQAIEAYMVRLFYRIVLMYG